MPKRNSQEDFGMLSQFVQWAELSGEEAENFVKEMMTRRGHKPVTSWADGDGDDKGDGKPTNVLGINFGGPKKDTGSGSGWQYTGS